MPECRSSATWSRCSAPAPTSGCILYRTRGPLVLLDSPIIPSVAAMGPDAIQAIYSNRNKDYS